MFDVLESAQFIAENSSHVSIPKESLPKIAHMVLEQMKQQQYSTKTWKAHPLNPKTANKEAIDWIFLVDLLNFSFWSATDRPDGSLDPERYTVYFDGVPYSGYWSLCAAINRALAAGIPITDPAYYGQQATDDQLADVFRSDTSESIPMLPERIALLRQAGQILCNHFQGSFLHVIEQANHSAQSLLALIVEHFPCFRDVAEFKGRQVVLFKRAQILIADIWACFDGQGLGYFKDIDSITMFADYRVPQILHYFGLLAYSPELTHHLEQRKETASGSPFEVEIRGNSIWAVELLKRQILTIEPTAAINAILLDFYIWDTAKQREPDLRKVPFHRNRCIFY